MVVYPKIRLLFIIDGLLYFADCIKLTLNKEIKPNTTPMEMPAFGSIADLRIVETTYKEESQTNVRFGSFPDIQLASLLISL